MKLRAELPLLAAAASAWLGQADGFFTKNKSIEKQLENVNSALYTNQDIFANEALNADGTININGGTGQNGRTISSSGYGSEDATDSTADGEEVINYPNAGTGMMTGIHSSNMLKNIGATGAGGSSNSHPGQKGRSGKGASNSEEGNVDENPISTPQNAIDEAHENDIMILSSDYMYVSNCLLRKRHATDPIRQRAFELFKQTAAGDWFIVFGYVCGDDWSCWKKNVQNLLAKKGEEYGGGVIGRCVSRLVREKAEGLRTRRRREVLSGRKGDKYARRRRDLGLA